MSKVLAELHKKKCYLKYMSKVKSMNFSLISDIDKIYRDTPTETGLDP